MRKVYDLALKELGTYEWAEGDNPVVLKYYADAGNPQIKHDSVPWCAAFVGAMINRAGGRPTYELLARSYLEWGTVVKWEDARPGDVIVFQRGNSSWQGHVAFFEKWNGKYVQVLGGNQRDRVSQAKYLKSKILGIRRGPASLDLAPIKKSLWAILLAFFLGKGKTRHA